MPLRPAISSKQPRKRKRANKIVSVTPVAHDGLGIRSKEASAPENNVDGGNENESVGMQKESVAPSEREPPQEPNVAANENPAVGAQPPIIPPAAPGAKKLSDFCSSYRSKPLHQEDANRPSAVSEDLQPPVAEDEQEATPSGPVVEVIDGEIVLQEKSVVMPGARRSVQEVDEAFQHVVEEEGPAAIVRATYKSFLVGRRGPQRWKVDETKRFYEALQQLGTDFATMEAFFGNRTKRQLKRKYQQEIVKNPDLIEMALDRKFKKNIDLSVFDVNPSEVSALSFSSDIMDNDIADTTAAQKEKDSSALTSGDNAVLVDEAAGGVVEEDAIADGVGMSQSASGDVVDKDSFLWPLEETENHVTDETILDEFREEETEETENVNDHEALLSLVPSRMKAKPKRPKFRSKTKAKTR